jgi:hypothetical protein
VRGDFEVHPIGTGERLKQLEALLTGAEDGARNAIDGRRGNWLQTWSGRQFWPLDPRPEEIHIGDIAHALSNACRYGGHCNRFYSVAEHSVLVSQVVPPEHALIALLHDATEAYCVDVPRPLKPALSGYKAIEHGIWLAVAARFGLPGGMPNEVKAADNAVLLAEQAQIMKAPPAPWCTQGEPAAVTILCLPPMEARALFLRRFHELAQ